MIVWEPEEGAFGARVTWWAVGRGRVDRVDG